MLGEGSQGTVCKALDTRTGEFVAIKEIIMTEEQAGEALKEIEILKKLNHDNIIKYITTIKKPTCMYIVLEFIENGSIKDIVRKFGELPEPLAVSNLIIFIYFSVNRILF